MEKRTSSIVSIFVIVTLLGAITLPLGFVDRVAGFPTMPYNIYGDVQADGDGPPGGIVIGGNITAWIDGVCYGNATTNASAHFDLYVKGDYWGLPYENAVKDGGYDGDLIQYFLDYHPMDYYLNISDTTSTFMHGGIEGVVPYLYFDIDTRWDGFPILVDTYLRGLKINEIVLEPADGDDQYLYLYDPGGELGEAALENASHGYYIQKDNNETHTPNGTIFDFNSNPTKVINWPDGSNYYYINLTGFLLNTTADELKLVWKNPINWGGAATEDNIANGTDVIVDRVEWGNHTNYINYSGMPIIRDYDNTTMGDFWDPIPSGESIIRSDVVPYDNNGTDTDNCTVDFILNSNPTPRGKIVVPPVAYVQINTASGGGGINLCEPWNYLTVGVGYTATFYGASYSSSGAFIEDVPVTSNWTSDNSTVVSVDTPTGNSTNISCNIPGIANITLNNTDAGGITNFTQVTVLDYTVDYVLIRDAPDGGGLNLCDPANYSSFPVGYNTTFYGATYNFSASGDGYIGPVSSISTWVSGDPLKVSVSSPGDNSTIQCSITDWGPPAVTITLDYDDAHVITNTTNVTVLTPTVDYIQIRDGPGGTGTNLSDPANYPNYPLGFNTTFYSAAYNNTAGYLWDVPVTWGSNDTANVSVNPLFGAQTNINCSNVNFTTVNITMDDGAGHTNFTWVTILNITIDYIQIRTEPGGGGINLCDLANYSSYPVGHNTIYYAAAYNGTSFITDITVSWSSSDNTIVYVDPGGSSTNVMCNKTNWGGPVTIEADDGDGHTNTTNVTVLEPTVDYIQIRTEPGGGGVNLCDPANYLIVGVGNSTTFYGAEYNNTAGYIGAVPVNSTWNSDNITIVIVDLFGNSSTVTCNNTNWGNVTITLDYEGTSVITNTTNVTVLEPTVDYIQIRTASGGGGVNLSDPANYPSYPVGYSTTFYGAVYNNTAGYIGPVPATSTWNSDNITIVIVGPTGNSSTVTCNNTSWGNVTITLDYEGTSVITNTTQVTVLEPTLDYINIRDEANGEGNIRTRVTLEEGNVIVFYAAGYNRTAGFIEDITDAEWAIDNVSIGSLEPTTGNSTNFTGIKGGAGIITVTHPADSSMTNQTNVTVIDTTDPPAPESLDATVYKGDTYLGWTPVDAPDLAGYRIERREPGGTWEQIGAVDAATTTFTDEEVVEGKTYEYRIVAVDDDDRESSPSPEKSVEIPKPKEDGIQWILLWLFLIIAIVVVLLFLFLWRMRREEEGAFPPPYEEAAEPEEMPPIPEGPIEPIGPPEVPPGPPIPPEGPPPEPPLPPIPPEEASLRPPLPPEAPPRPPMPPEEAPLEPTAPPEAPPRPPMPPEEAPLEPTAPPEVPPRPPVPPEEAPPSPPSEAKKKKLPPPP